MENFNILALSGGGYRGLYSAKVLETLESQLKEPIASHFDLIAGTSVGGIIALALAYEIPAKKIVSFFEENGDLIFPKTIPFIKEKLFGLFQPKYKNTGLRKCLFSIFGDATIGDLKHRVIIPTINYTKGYPQLFKTRHHDNFRMDCSRKLIDVALATSAAPTYFPIYKRDYGDFVDGGLIANHPGFFGLIEAEQFLDISKDEIHMLHIGTLSQDYTSNGNPKRGLLQWNVKLINLIFSCQEKSTDQILRFLLAEKYSSIDETITPEQSNVIGLDIKNYRAKKILIQRAEESVKNYVSKDHWRMIKNHIAAPFCSIPLN